VEGEIEGQKQPKGCFFVALGVKRATIRYLWRDCESLGLGTGEAEMKKGIHPEYVDCSITCACGEVIHTRSVVPTIRVEICSKCHPFFTGRQKLVEKTGQGS
jgi:large subunit ribosomal protein L31